MKIPRRRDLVQAPELAVLAVVETALLALERSLCAEHPMLLDLSPADPPTISAARHVLSALRPLRRAARRYRAAVRDSQRPSSITVADDPF